MIIAIDGPAASGKGTIARRIADHFDLNYLDSGTLYRAVAASVLNRGGSATDRDLVIEAARTLDPDAINPDALRTREVGAMASVVAAISEVRHALIDFQRAFASRGAVLDGRDIGTVVLPQADVKLFVTASPRERARRRAAELTSHGETVSEADILRELKERDRRDRDRAVAPLRQADDALLLDTTDLDIEAAFQVALALIESRLDIAAKDHR